MATRDPISPSRLDDCACGAVAGRIQRSGRPGRAAVAGRHQQSSGLGPGRVVLLLAILHRLVGLLVALRIAFLAMFAAGGAQGTAFVPPLLRKGRQNVGDLAATDRGAAPGDHDSRPAHPAAAIRGALLAGDAVSHPGQTNQPPAAMPRGRVAGPPVWRSAADRCSSRRCWRVRRVQCQGKRGTMDFDISFRLARRLGTRVTAFVLSRPSRRTLSSTSSPACRMSNAARRSSEVSARDHKDGATTWANTTVNGLLVRQVLVGSMAGSVTRDVRRTVNPLFVQAVVGWPNGWTGFGPAATAWSSWLRRMR